MNEVTAQRVAVKLGIRYDGAQEGIGSQFTDVQVTGTTFYGNTPSEVEENLEVKRRLFRVRS